MSELTLDEAIKHCLEVAEQNETQADKIGRQFIGSAMDKRATDCRECAADHRQLAEWLTDLKELRNSIGAVKLKEMKEAVRLLQELNAENDQLTSQLVEAKRLLKAAVEDLNSINRVLEGNDILCVKYIACEDCPFDAENCHKWRHANEARTLMGDEPNGI